MENIEEQTKSPSVESIEGNQDQMFSPESLARMKKIVTVDDWKKLTEEEKVLDIATRAILKVIVKSEKQLSLEVQEQLLEKTKRQVIAERNQARQMLKEAEIHLQNLVWNNMIPSLMNTPIRGIMSKFIVAFGDFVWTKHDGWIYRPTISQMMEQVKRWPNKRGAEQFATIFRTKLKPKTIAGRQMHEETEDMKELKGDIQKQLTELQETM